MTIKTYLPRQGGKSSSSYADYWNYIHFAVTHSFDLDDLRDAIKNQKIVADSVIIENHQQHPCYTPDTALYLDALKVFKETRNK